MFPPPTGPDFSHCEFGVNQDKLRTAHGAENRVFQEQRPKNPTYRKKLEQDIAERKIDDLKVAVEGVSYETFSTNFPV
ncbi:MAG: hypothetical protein HOC91_00420 [Nitrospinaceae bacterium]|nr:hypothetical protein [Nitrospinaceae bacterium]MBT4428958.1 hypothetical protein [Nitrospinaceae bacterium]MBT7855852.1 hypothetical protein [Nitrospinaceae bacterium]